MELTESIRVDGSKLEVTEATIEAINRTNETVAYTIADADRLLIAEGVLIGDRGQTSNENLYTAEFQTGMLEKWAGTPMVFGDTDHAPDAPDVRGWIYDAELRESNGHTETVGRFVIPKIPANQDLIERLQNGLGSSLSISVDVPDGGATCLECGESINCQTGECSQNKAHKGRKIQQGEKANHVAVVAQSAYPNARVTRLSEAMRLSETLADVSAPEPDPQTVMLINEAMEIRKPLIAECVKFSRLFDPNQELPGMAERFEKWRLSELTYYRDSQKAAFQELKRTGQLAVASDRDEPSKPPGPWKSLDEVTKQNQL